MGTTFKPTLFPHGTLMYLFDGYRLTRTDVKPQITNSEITSVVAY